MKTITCPKCGHEFIPPSRILAGARAIRNGEDIEFLRQVLEDEGLRPDSISMELSQQTTLAKLDEINWERFNTGKLSVRQAYRIAVDQNALTNDEILTIARNAPRRTKRPKWQHAYIRKKLVRKK